MGDPAPFIMLVDDEARVLRALDRQLRRLAPAWQLAFHTAGAQVLEAMQQRPADVVVTDLAMPGLSGLELAARLRRDHPGTGVVMLSGTADLDAAIRALNEGNIFRFLTKPARGSELVEAIEDALAVAASSTPDAGRGLAALNRISTGVVVTDVRSRVLFVNRAAARVLDAHDGLLIDAAGHLRALRAEVSERLRDEIQNAASGSGTSRGGTSFAVERGASPRPLSLVVAPLEEQPGEALVFVSDPEHQVVPSVDMLRTHMGLSRAEATLARSLTEGLKLDAAAARGGITVGTARTYLKQVFQKTGTGRQAELLKLIFT